jgi:hypothetical protein
VDVESTGIGVQLDNDVINRFKYVKGCSVLTGPVYEQDKDGKTLLLD